MSLLSSSMKTSTGFCMKLLQTARISRPFPSLDKALSTCRTALRINEMQTSHKVSTGHSDAALLRYMEGLVCLLGFQLGWHLQDLGVVVGLNFLELLWVIGSDEVDSNTLTTETTASANSVNVVLFWAGDVVVDD